MEIDSCPALAGQSAFVRPTICSTVQFPTLTGPRGLARGVSLPPRLAWRDLWIVSAIPSGRRA